jgi:hypothetical protein
VEIHFKDDKIRKVKGVIEIETNYEKLNFPYSYETIKGSAQLLPETLKFESIFFGQKLTQPVSIKNNFPVAMKVIHSKIKSSSFVYEF